MTLSRRHFLAGSLLTGCASRPSGVGCASLAGQSVRWIVPFAAGGGNDLYSRLFEKYFEKALGAEIVISNEPGGGSLVGLTKLRDAAPDGRTLGVLNTPGLLSASLFGQAEYPSPTRDFTILGRLAATPAAIVTGAQSPLRTIEDLLEHQRRKPLLCGITGVASNNLLNVAVAASLLGVQIDYVAGFNGSPEVQLAAMRGDVDLLSNAYPNLQPVVESGDLRVLLQLSDGPISDHPALKGVAWLAGPDGWAARRASETGRSLEEALADAATLVSASAAGLTAAAPKGIPAELRACLRAAFDAAVQDSELQAAASAAQRPFNTMPGDQAEAVIVALETGMGRFAPVVRGVMERLTQ